jgi:hypothetical protein
LSSRSRTVIKIVSGFSETSTRCSMKNCFWKLSINYVTLYGEPDLGFKKSLLSRKAPLRSRDIAHVVSRRLHNSSSQVGVPANSCGICGGRSDTKAVSLGVR